MSIASTPDLVVAACRSGVLGCFPTHNAWKDDVGLEGWLTRITSELAGQRSAAPFAVNINVSRRKPPELLERELELCRASGVSVITTNVGDPSAVVEQVHGWGGVVIHDAVDVRQAERAADAGVDGLMLVCAGAGGLGGLLSPFAFVPRVRAFFPGLIQVAGGASTGRAIAAARVLGADMVCMGTRFIATAESGVVDGHKTMLVDADLSDVQWTESITGIGANFLRPSIVRNGLDPDALPSPTERGRPAIPREIKPWSMVWSGGQSVGSIASVLSVAQLVDQLDIEYRQART